MTCRAAFPSSKDDNVFTKELFEADNRVGMDCRQSYDKIFRSSAGVEDVRLVMKSWMAPRAGKALQCPMCESGDGGHVNEGYSAECSI